MGLPDDSLYSTVDFIIKLFNRAGDCIILACKLYGYLNHKKKLTWPFRAKVGTSMYVSYYTIYIRASIFFKSLYKSVHQIALKHIKHV